MEATFDELLIRNEKKEAKSKKINLPFFNSIIRFKNKTVKKRQIRLKIKRLKSDLNKTQDLFTESLTDPTIDSVDLKLCVINIEKKLKATKDLYKQLFYNRLVLLFIKLFTSKN